MKKSLSVFLTILSIAVNVFVLGASFVLASIVKDSYATTPPIPSMWRLFLPVIGMGILFVLGIVLLCRHKTWAHVLVAAPLLLSLLFLVIPFPDLRTPAMRQFDERNQRWVECMAKKAEFERTHPDQVSIAACPF